MELREMFRSVRRRKWLVVLVFLAAVGASAAMSAIMPPAYQATATIRVSLAPSPSLDYYGALLSSERLARTYAELIASRPVLEAVIKRLGLTGTARELRRRVHVVALEGTELITVSAIDRGAARAALIANTVADVFLQSVAPPQGTQTRESLTVVVRAIPPDTPVRPRPIQYGVIAGVAGLLAGLGLALLLAYVDTRFASASEAESHLSMPVLATVPRNGRVSTVRPDSPIAEAARTVRIGLQLAGVGDSLRSLVFTSVGAQEGKTTIASYLAVAFAQSGVSTILVDADLRRPRVHATFGLPNRTGLAEMLLEGLPPSQVLHETTTPGLRVVTSGALPARPADLLSSAAMDEAVRQLRAAADVVIYDSPPAGALADAMAIASKVDGVVLVVDAERAGREGVLRVRHQLERARSRLLGVVMNAEEPEVDYSYPYTGARSGTSHRS